MATTAAQRNRAIRQEALREQLSKQKLVEKVLDISEKMQKPDFDNADLPRLRAAADINLALIKKYLPDVKQTELTGEGGGPVEAKWTVEVTEVAKTTTS